MKTFDVVIVGGGLIGCASAFYLSKMGARVVVVEKDQLNQGASGRNAGSLHFQLEYRLLKHQKQLADQLAVLIPLAQVAILQWQHLEQELGQDLELKMNGGLMVAETAGQVALLQQKSQFEIQHGLAVELLSGAEVRRLAPYLSKKIQAGLLCEQEGHCNPRYLTLAFAKSAEKMGAKFLTKTRLCELARRGDGWQLSVQQKSRAPELDRIQAGAVLNTAGAWAGEVGVMAGVHLPIFPVALNMNVTEEAPPFIHHLIQHVGRQLSMKQVEDGNLLIGGGWGARLGRDGKAWLSDEAHNMQNSIQGNLDAACATVPQVSGLHLLRSWTGVTAITADQLPLVGEVSQTPGFYVAAGGAGFTYGPTYAQLISELIVKGETSYPIDSFSPDRYDHINMFMG